MYIARNIVSIYVCSTYICLVISGGKLVAFGEEYNKQQRRNQILARHATTQNFENPEIFNALTEAQKAEMYRQRAVETKHKSEAQLVKSVVKSSVKMGGSVAGAIRGHVTGS